MKTIMLTLVFSFLSFLSSGQDCECFVSQIENNTVESCNLIIGTTVTVSDVSELQNAINVANQEGGNKTILIEDGIYSIASTSQYPYITASNMVFRSLSGNRDAVILTGQGMKDVAPDTEIGMYLVGDNITVADLTIRDVGNHGISIGGDDIFIHNVKIQNTYEQMIKGSSTENGLHNSIVQCSLFEYTEEIGPQWYIGGLDIHGGHSWIVRDNVFKHIESPSQAVAEHAVHFWDNCSDNTVERNVIIDCDRGIGFGLGSSPNDGGIIRNNMIVNDGSGIFNDVGIGIESSPNTKIYNNTVHVAYQNAIEYRFETTTNVEIANNLTNRPITSRNDGVANLSNNYIEAETSWYMDATTGNLRLVTLNPNVHDQGTDLSGVVDYDIDQLQRPQGDAYDIGAQEYFEVSSENKEVSLVALSVFPNPSSGLVTIRFLDNRVPSLIFVLNSQGVKIEEYSDVMNVDFSHLGDGMYYLIIQGKLENRSVISKLVICH